MTGKKFSTVAFTALLKFLLMIFNILFIIIGIVLVIIGAYGITAFKDFFTFSPGNAIFVPIICVGLFMAIIGVLSLWCTPKGVTWLLKLYSIVVFLLFLALFTLSILFMVKRDTFEQSIKDGIDTSLKEYPENYNAIDLLQENIHCCGVNSYKDWFATKYAKNTTSVPSSCCKVNLSVCKYNNVTASLTDIYVEGCYKIMYDTIESKYVLIGGIGFGSSVIVLLGTILTCTLAHHINKNKYDELED